jgi:hypothetical protein
MSEPESGLEAGATQLVEEGAAAGIGFAEHGPVGAAAAAAIEAVKPIVEAVKEGYGAVEANIEANEAEARNEGGDDQ